MKVAADAPVRIGEKRDEIVVDIARLDRGDAETAGGIPFDVQGCSLVKQALQKPGQAKTPAVRSTLTIRTQVDPRQNDLLDAGARERRAFLDDLVERSADGASTGDMDDAVRACIVASVLHLDPHARGKGSLTRPDRPVAVTEGRKNRGKPDDHLAEIRLEDARDTHILDTSGLEARRRTP